MITRGSAVVLKMLANVQQKTIKPLIKSFIAAGAQVYTDEYSSYDRLEFWRYEHKRVNHSAGEYARDEDGDGFCEVLVNTFEGLWSLLRSWLRPHRGILQEKLPLYLGFFEFIHNSRARGKTLLPALLSILLSP
jgi:transposase-like protein